MPSSRTSTRWCFHGGEVIASGSSARGGDSRTTLYVNGVAVKLRGRNRHDSDPYVGYAVDLNIWSATSH